MEALWHYRARIVRVIDSDSLEAYLDFGMHTYRVERIRVLGVDAPEANARDPLVRAAAQAATAFTAAWLAEHAAHLGAVGELTPAYPFLLRTEKSDNFGRWLSSVRCGHSHSLAADLLAVGHAVPYPK